MVGTLRLQGPYISNHSVLNNPIDTHQSFTWKEENILKGTAGDLSSHTDKLLKINELEQLWRHCKANQIKPHKIPIGLRKALVGCLHAEDTLSSLACWFFLLCVPTSADDSPHLLVFSWHSARLAQKRFSFAPARREQRYHSLKTPFTDPCLGASLNLAESYLKTSQPFLSLKLSDPAAQLQPQNSARCPNFVQYKAPWQLTNSLRAVLS